MIPGCTLQNNKYINQGNGSPSYRRFRSPACFMYQTGMFKNILETALSYNRDRTSFQPFSHPLFKELFK